MTEADSPQMKLLVRFVLTYAAALALGLLIVGVALGTTASWRGDALGLVLLGAIALVGAAFAGAGASLYRGLLRSGTSRAGATWACAGFALLGLLTWAFLAFVALVGSNR